MRSALVVMAVLALAACSDDEIDPTVPTTMEPVSGDGQFADAGTMVPDPLTIRILNLNGDPVEGVTVEWVVNLGGGTLSADETVTDENGIAQVTYTLGTLVGTQTASAVNNNLVGSPVLFTATARPNGGGGGPPVP